MKGVLNLILLLIITCAGAQDLRLAQNYYDNGEYEKALKIYKKTYLKDVRRTGNLFKLVDTYHQLENYVAVDSLLKEARKISPRNQQLVVELGYNNALMGQDALAVQYYDQAIKTVDSIPGYSYQVASQFEKRNLLDRAIAAYEIGQERVERANFSFQLARLYGEQGNLEKMYGSYLDLMERNKSYKARAQALFSQYVSDDASNEGNKVLRKTLLLRLRNNPDALYNELLSWLFIQQQDFNNAFIQEKALYARDRSSINGLKRLAVLAIDEKDYPAARSILDYIIEETQVRDVRYLAHTLKLKLLADTATVATYGEVQSQYEELLNLYGRDASTFKMQLDYSNFLAFKANKVQPAISLMNTLQDYNLSNYQKAIIKMQLADVLVLEEQFNRALILYSQVQNDLPNNELAQESQYRVARTSYFQGDFNWALTQLKVLRSASSKLIANDAMELSLTISDHILQDTTGVALQAFAKADLKKYQGKIQESIAAFQIVLQEHKGDPIEDEALFYQATMYQLSGDIELAAANYQRLLDNFEDSILRDDTYYNLALLYQEQLEDESKAQSLYERIIYDHADSIHFVDARRRYRRLRGDENTKAF